jgi:hypothetical protein
MITKLIVAITLLNKDLKGNLANSMAEEIAVKTVGTRNLNTKTKKVDLMTNAAIEIIIETIIEIIIEETGNKTKTGIMTETTKKTGTSIKTKTGIEETETTKKEKKKGSRESNMNLIPNVILENII